MLRVGLTGGIGSGKSTVADRLATLGAVVVDADAISREVVAAGSPGLEEIREAFGAAVLDGRGELDRAAMANLIFSDPDARTRLNRIVHPRVGAAASESAAATEAAERDSGEPAVFVHDVPLLVENGMQHGYHLVIVVDAPVEDRVTRVTESRGMAVVDARARIRSQAGEEQRRAVADIWLDNSGSAEALRETVSRLWQERLRPFAEHLLRAEPAPWPDAAPAGKTAESWAADAARLGARVRAELPGDVTVDHVGPTAGTIHASEVSVLDLLVAVPDLVTLSIRQREELAERLRGMGFFATSEIANLGWISAGEVYSSADPGLPAQLHLTEPESAVHEKALRQAAHRRPGTG